MKQSFHFKHKDGRVFGCSFTKARNGQYFGRVTIYNSEKDYKDLPLMMNWQGIKNIPLQGDTPVKAGIELKEYCLENFSKKESVKWEQALKRELD